MIRNGSGFDDFANPVFDNSTLLIGEECINKGLRVDGRSLDSYRYVGIEFNGPAGNAVISFGGTIVFCCIAQEVVEPNSERPNEGFLFFHVEAAPFTSESYDPGKTTDLEHFLIYFVEHIYKESSCLDLETLCITSGKQVWALRVCIHVLQDDGNLLAACTFAALATLLHYRKPSLKESAEFNFSPYTLWHKAVPLSIYHIPILVTVWITPTSGQFVLDATSFEERILGTQVSVLLNQFGEVIWIYKGGSTPLPRETLKAAVSATKNKATKLYAILKHELVRNDGMLSNLLVHINSQ